MDAALGAGVAAAAAGAITGAQTGNVGAAVVAGAAIGATTGVVAGASGRADGSGWNGAGRPNTRTSTTTPSASAVTPPTPSRPTTSRMIDPEETKRPPGFRDCRLSLRYNNYYIANRGGTDGAARIDVSWQAEIGALGARGELKRLSYRFEVHFRRRLFRDGEAYTRRSERSASHNIRDTAVLLQDQMIVAPGIIDEVLSVRIVPGTMRCRW